MSNPTPKKPRPAHPWRKLMWGSATKTTRSAKRYEETLKEKSRESEQSR